MLMRHTLRECVRACMPSVSDLSRELERGSARVIYARREERRCLGSLNFTIAGTRYRVYIFAFLRFLRAPSVNHARSELIF